MNPALWGGVCALNLGVADFLARFSSRAIGASSALLGMLLVGFATLSLWALVMSPPLVWAPAFLWLVALNGAATTVMTLLLYWGLARGPVSVVAPIVASHPVLVVAFWVLLGHRPSAIQWIAMLVTVTGVVIVARSAERFESQLHTSGSALRVTVWIALGSALAYAALVIAGQAAVPVYGEFQTLWLGRSVSLAAILLIFLVRRERPRLPMKWWPLLGAQGLLDAFGYLSLFAGSRGEASEVAAVTASTFGAVTTLLAHFVLRESITVLQWIGIAMVFAGVAVLTAYV